MRFSRSSSALRSVIQTGLVMERRPCTAKVKASLPRVNARLLFQFETEMSGAGSRGVARVVRENREGNRADIDQQADGHGGPGPGDQQGRQAGKAGQRQEAVLAL